MMETFKFRLEKVWKHRQKIVDENSVAAASADRKVAALSRQIVELDHNIARHARSMVQREGNILHSGDLTAGATWQAHLHHLGEDLDNKLQTAVKDLERCRSRLTGSWRDLEVLSRLRDTQSDNWRAGQNRRERKQMDEIGQIRAFRQTAAKGSR